MGQGIFPAPSGLGGHLGQPRRVDGQAMRNAVAFPVLTRLDADRLGVQFGCQRNFLARDPEGLDASHLGRLVGNERDSGISGTNDVADEGGGGHSGGPFEAVGLASLPSR